MSRTLGKAALGLLDHLSAWPQGCLQIAVQPKTQDHEPQHRNEYLDYYNNDRKHMSLQFATPKRVLAIPRS